MVIYQAHKGVSSDYPENTMRAYRAAVREGYGIIECDPKYTKDGVIVLLHDRTVNRTGRNPDGSAISEETKIADLTLAEAEKLDFGVWKAPEFAGEKLPTLAELLAFAEESGIRLKIDNVWESFPPEMRDAMLKQLGNSHANIGVTCKTPEDLRLVAETLPRAELHYDGGDLSAERIREITEIARGRELTVWVCYDNAKTAWFKGTKADPEVCGRVKASARLGIWILSKPEEAEKAIRVFGADVIETNGELKPNDATAKL